MEAADRIVVEASVARRALNWAGSPVPALGVPRWFAIAAVLGFVFRVLLWLQDRGSPLSRYLVGDEYHYWLWAERIAAGSWIPREVFHQGPLFPYALAVLMKSFPSFGQAWLAAGQLLLNWVTCLLLLFLLRAWLAENVALTAATMALFFTPAVFFALKRMPTTLGILLLVGGLLALPTGKGGWGRRCLIAGMLLGFAVLAVPSTLLVLGASALYLFLRPPGNRRLPPAAVLVLAGFLVILPATVSNFLQDGSLMLVSGDFGVVFAQGNNPRARGSWSRVEGVSTFVTEEIEDTANIARRETGRQLDSQEVSQYFFKRGLRFIVENPGSWARLELRKAVLLASGLDVPHEFSLARERRDFLPLLWAFPLGAPVVLLLASFALLDREVRRRLLLPLTAAAALGGTSLLFYVANRFALPCHLLLLPAAAAGLLALPRLVAHPGQAVVFLPVTLAAILAGGSLRDPGWESNYLAKLVSAYEEAGDLPGVALTLERMAKVLPDAPFVFAAMGDVYRAQGDPSSALLAYERGLRLQPDDRDTRFARATLLGEMGRGAEALAELERLLESDPQDQRARNAFEDLARWLNGPSARSAPSAGDGGRRP